ncbi:hypothetical protein BDW74DRAFT_189723 [Aspergillus multicolor]|uniref:Zn(II)2Cys6 transcription factor n=1 Tax=Aspergillus multicolor TaxID=41759 RepID=UPI003CCDFD55
MASRHEVAQNGVLPVSLMRNKFVACRKCHARKVRCPGGQPCQTCVQMNCEPECVYPKRDRQIKISQSYLEGLLQENKALRSRIHPRRPGVEGQPAVLEAATAQGDEEEDEECRQHDSERVPSQNEGSIEEPSKNPLLHERPWFLPIQSSSTPIWIGEIADAAFATRVRQVLLKTETNHIPRISYPRDDEITIRAGSSVRTLGSAQAQFLLRTALAHLQGRYHIVRRGAVKRLLNQYLRDLRSLDVASSHFRGPEQDAPGLDFFRNATEGYGLLQERPSIDCIESLYSLCINRRHSAYILSSSAMRHSNVLGLHFNLPSTQVPDIAEREHLKRIWWTAYVLDYTCASISSLLLSTRDDDIFTDLPAQISCHGDSDFQDTDIFTARICLATLGRGILRLIYGRMNAEPFVQRVQCALRDLRRWLQELPDHLQMQSDESRPKDERVTSLHLFFNQCLILATRPVLLHVLSTRTVRKREGLNDTHNKPSENARAIAEACIRCARHSYNVINESWIGGSFWTFDYFNTQYLFSAATILGISSSLGGSDAANDREDFEFAGQLLGKLQSCGSFSAMELQRHYDALKDAMDTFCSEIGGVSIPPAEAVASTAGNTDTTGGPGTNNPSGEGDVHVTSQPQAAYPMTSGIALSEPSLEAFLTESEPNMDLDNMDFFFDMTQQESLYWSMT